MKKITLFVSGALGSLGGLLVPFLSHAQFAVATSTEATNNGGYLTSAYSETINALGPTGVVVFVLVITVLSIIIGLMWQTPHKVLPK